MTFLTGIVFMFRRKFLKLITGFTICSAIEPLMATETIPSLKMGVFPRRNARITYRLFSPMAAYLSSKLGVDVKLVIEKDFATFWRAVKQRKFDLVHFNQYHYVVAQKHFGYNAILMNQEYGKSTVSGSIIVRKDSGINSITDLRGKTISFGGGPRAMQSYIVANLLLNQGGVTNDSYTTKFALNPPNAVISTFNKQNDAAGAGDVVLQLDTVKNQIDTSQMKYLTRSDPEPHLPWAVTEMLPEVLQVKIQSILSNLQFHPSGQRILKRAELTALIPAKDSDYDGAREKIITIYGNDFGLNRLQ